MTQRFFVPAESLVRDKDGAPVRVALDRAIAHQLRNVLRMRAGDRVIVLDDSGWEYEVELIDLGSDGASAVVCEGRPSQDEPLVALTLYQGVLKGQHTEWVLQKGAELGIAAFVPIFTRRTIVTGAERVTKKRPRWERILCEAAEQSGRGRLPRLADPLSFADACREAATANDLALLAWEKASHSGQSSRPGSLVGVLHALDTPPQSVALLVGPEGGFEAQEVDLARECGIQVVTLGPRILRAETAALAAVAIVVSELEK